MSNPYSELLDKRDPLMVMKNTSAELERLFGCLSPPRVETSPATGQWSARQILCHLADCEIVFSFRIRKAVAERNHIIQGFDQDAWAERYSGYTVSQALETFASLRSWNVTLLSALDGTVLDKKVIHPQHGEITLKVIVETIAGHDLNHLKQIREILGNSG